MWSLTFDQPVQRPRLVFGGTREALPLEEAEGILRASRPIPETALYQLEARLADGTAWKRTEIRSLKVIKDQAPVLKVVQPTVARTELAPAAEVRVPIEVVASDDYGISETHLIATVAKGTGEAVKFREEKIAFDSDEDVAGEPGARRFGKTLDLLALGLEPGDEIYFYVEAADNRHPSPNRARSETRFIRLKGPEQYVSTPGAGVTGVNLVPEYFRSQRQIIIDTEKLIAERATLAEPDFRARANNLGIDQQLLRQRYGQFLGEEGEHFEGDGHDHSADPLPAPRTQAEVAAQFGHQHDSQDEATLFDRETKGTMRQALAAMWEAERLLRMAQPDEALAPENRALEILKELQQADRSYVQRVGFEASPLDVAGRRLRGDVSAVPPRRAVGSGGAEAGDATGAIRKLLRLAPWTRDRRALGAEELDALRKVEPTLTKAATEEPDRFLGALQELRSAQTREGARPNHSALERALLELLPRADARPSRRDEISTSLAEPYFRHLETAR